MRFSQTAVVLVVAVAALLDQSSVLVDAKKPSRSAPSRRPPSGGRSSGGRSSGRPPVSKRRYDDEEEDEDDGVFGLGPSDDDFEDEVDEYDMEEEEMPRSRPASRKPPSRSAKRPPSRSSRPSRSRYEDDEEDDYDRPPPRRSSSRGPPPSRGGRGRGPPPSKRGGRGGRVVPYSRQQAAPSAFSKTLGAMKNYIPDPQTVKETAMSSISAAKETTSSLSSNLYREVKGLTSSELEQVMLKATRPDDTPVKGKHAERLVGVTYQISARYDIYDAVLRKLWSKMAEKDWRTNIKALYILHRYAADGSPGHAPALKARLRELRRTKDPKRKDKYFNTKQLLAGDNKPENVKFRAFMSRYAHYVLLRAQMFGGMFDEISANPNAASKDSKKKAANKPITSSALRTEHLDGAMLLLKAGIACQLKDGEECENTAIAAERVASDMIGLSTSVAMALNRALKDGGLKGADPALLKKWCKFYSEELLPQTRAMVKKTSAKLDAYGLFLPSRMGATVSQDLLQKGLSLDEDSVVGGSAASDDASTPAKEDTAESVPDEEEEEEEEADDEVEATAAEETDAPVAEEVAAPAATDEGDEYDEYEYDEEEYYDDEEPF